MQEATETLARTSLFDAHLAAGARIVPFAGWEMPVQYKSGVIAEVKAVRENFGLFDVSHMGRVRVHGADALAFLQSLTVNDVSKLAAGKSQYSLLCREAGGVIDDIIVYRLGANEFIVVVNASNRAKALHWMEAHRQAFSQLFIEDETLLTGLIAVQGPNAVKTVDSLSDADLTVLARFGVTETVVSNLPVMVARTGYTGEDGVELFCRAEDATALWCALIRAGGFPCGLGARDTLRIEAAYPLYGHEMDEHTHPYEARLGWVVKTDKSSDFSGKATLTTLKTAPPNKVLIGVTMEGRAVPRDGYPVETASGEVVGHITSGTFSPTLGKGIALARVSASQKTAPDELLHVVIRDVRHAARVTPLPFLKNV